MDNKWLDEHTGNKWAYGMKYRPAQCGVTCPRDGYLLRLDTSPEAKHPKHPHGVIWYSRRLTDREVESYQLARL